MVTLVAVRTVLLAIVVVAALGAVGPQATYGEFSDGHGGAGSFNASSKFNGGGGMDCSDVGKHEVKADAGNDDVISEGNDTTLIGQACSNKGSIDSYSWTIIQNAQYGNLTTQTQRNTTFIAAEDVDSLRTVTVEFTAVNNKGNSDSDTANVTIIDES